VHPELAPFQVFGANWLATNPHAILADMQGVGKSAQAINAWELVGACKNLIVCPGIARHNWLREIERWSVVHRSTAAIMSSAKIPKADTLVVSYSLLRSIKVLRALIQLGPWETLILDEAQNAKNDAAWRTKALYGVNCDGQYGLASVAERIWLLSGTLMPRHPGELWPHCHALFPDVSQGMGYHRWVAEYCRKIPGTERIVGIRNGDQLAKLLRPHVIRRLAKDVNPELPELRLVHVPIRPDRLPPMSTELQETAEVVRKAMAAIEAKNSPLGAHLLHSAGDMALASLRKWTGVALAPAVADYVNNDMLAGLRKVVIFAEHRDVIATLNNALPGSAALHGGVPPGEKPGQRQYILDGFQERIQGFNPPVLICNIEMASTAIPLTAAHDCVFAECPWVPATVEQAIKRLHRMGQRNSVLARIFSLEGSVHEIVINVLTRRARELMRLNDALVTRPAALTR
jgi:SWI/SNF-related matrix-associated actin-dependent regulator of chromatin subfamily A-like protein 1